MSAHLQGFMVTLLLMTSLVVLLGYTDAPPVITVNLSTCTDTGSIGLNAERPTFFLKLILNPLSFGTQTNVCL